MKMNQRRMARPSLGGLLATRRGALTLALICAVCAAGMIVFALGRYRTNLRIPPKQTTVLVATGNIAKGTSGSAIAVRGLYKAQPIVASQMAPGAISDASLLAGKVVATAILPGQQLTLADFTGITGVTGVLPPNQRAVSISIDEAHGDTDVVQAGDRVDIYVQVSNPAKNGNELKLLEPNALVLKPAGTTTAASTGGQALAGSSMVLALPVNLAPMVAFASTNGTLYLTLRPANSSQTPPSTTTLQTLLSQTPHAG